MARTRTDLIVWDNGRAVARRVLSDGVHLIGRDDNCLVSLGSERVSREHARILVRGTSVVIEDLGSRNGIYFDGKRTGRHMVDDGDYIFVDPYVLEFQVKRIDPVRWSPRPKVVMNDAKQPGPRIAQLVLLTGSERRFRLDGTVTTLGRSTEHPVALEDNAASRNHAEVQRLGNVWVLRDLESANGTWVNGCRVREVSLKDGDEVRIGATLMRFDLRPAITERVRRAAG